jgi:hypothetical protein
MAIFIASQGALAFLVYASVLATPLVILLAFFLLRRRRDD